MPLNFFFVLGPIADLIGLALGLIAFLVIYRASGAMQKKSEYKREKKYYNKNKSNYPQQEQYRVANVKKQIDALKPQLEAAQAELKSYEETVDGLAKYMKFSLMTSVTPERLPLLRRYIENMRADTPSEAEKAYNMDQNHKLKLEQLAADFLKQQKDLERIAVLCGISVSSAEINMEHARYEIDESMFVQYFCLLLDSYKECNSMRGTLTSLEEKAKRLQDKINNPDDPDVIFGRKAKMRQQQQECSEELAVVKQQIAELTPRVISNEETYKAFRAKLLHPDYHDDFAVRCICIFIKHGLAKDIKKAIEGYHLIKNKMELKQVAADFEKELNRMRRKMGADEKYAKDLQVQADAYAAQTAANNRAAESSMTAASNYENL